jgi:PAS domain S-box-containing protein
METFLAEPDRPAFVAETDAFHLACWRCLFDEAEEPQVICRSDGTVVEINLRASQLLGLTCAEADPNPRLVDLLAPAAGRRLATALKANPVRAETIAAITVLCSGRIGMIADLHVLPLGDQHALVIFRDASKRWRMESHAQRLITAVDSTPDVVFLTDQEFHIAFVNAAFNVVTGHSVEDVLGREADFLRAPSEAAKVLEYRAAIGRGEGWVGELLNLRSNGEVYPVEAAISPIFDKRGGLLGYSAFERDISAKRRMQEEITLQRDYVQSIINSLDAAVYTIDRQFRLTHISDGWRKLPPQHGWLTLSAPPLAGACLLDLVRHPARRAELKELFESVLELRQPREIDTASEDLNYHWLIKIAPWWHRGDVAGLIYTVTDHTYLHQLKNQLYQAQKMETIGALAAGVAHDFNNLLLAVRGNVGLLLMDDALPTDARKRLEGIDQAAHRAAGITQQLLSFSRASDERETVLDFNEVIKEASQLARRSIKSNVKVRLQVHASAVKVRMDSTRAQQLLLNLCINALDAMPEGGQLTLANELTPLPPALAAKLQQPVGTQFLCCRVSDTGAGIPPEVLPRVFNPFFTTKDKDQGTGLGLAIVQSIVTKAKGAIEVATAVNQGTCFSVYLPLAQAGVTARAALPDTQLSYGTGRIMVVDDLDLVLDFTRSFLTAAGYDVLVASSAEQALEMMECLDRPVDLLFTDYNMTGKNGAQLIREVSARWPGVRFVLVSGYLEESQRIQVEEELHARILHKPFNMREATDLVARVLRRNLPEPAVEPASSPQS